MAITEVFKKKNIQLFAFGLFFVSLFWGMPFSNIGISTFLVYFIIMLFVNGIQLPKRKYLLLLFPLLYFVVVLVSTLIYGTDKSIGFEIEQKSSFLLIPLLFSLQKDEDKISLKQLMSGFVVASTISVFVLFFIHIFRSGIAHIPKYKDFSLYLHPGYFSMYLTFGVFFLLKYWKRWNVKSIILLAGIVIVHLAGIYFADSKAGILIFFVLMFFLIVKRMSHYNRWLSVALSVVVIAVFISLFSFNSRFVIMKNVLVNYNDYIEHPEFYVESTAERIQVWYSAYHLIPEKFWLGYGNGRSGEALMSKYQEYGFAKSVENKLNAHNQYLEVWLQLGVVGLLLLLFLLIIPLFKIQKNKQSLYFAFLMLIALNFLFESMLQTQAGIVFFSFFWCAFVVLKMNENSIKSSVV